MNNVTINAPRDMDTGNERAWEGWYRVTQGVDAAHIYIEARGSAIEVVVAKIADDYYISSPSYGVAIPSIPYLTDLFWITEQLINRDVPAPDAVSVAHVLADIGEF